MLQKFGSTFRKVGSDLSDVVEGKPAHLTDGGSVASKA